MARIAGVDLPRDKRIEYALPYIYGIGLTLSREILAKKLPSCVKSWIMNIKWKGTFAVKNP